MKNLSSVLYSTQLIALVTPYFVVFLGWNILQNAWYAMLGYHLLIVLFLVLNMSSRYTWTNLFGTWKPLWLLTTAAASAGSGVVLYLIWPLLNTRLSLQALTEAVGLSGSAWYLFVVYFCLVNTWLEELYWRGYLGNSSRGVHITDFAFAGYHCLVISAVTTWPWQLLTIGVLVVAAWWWRQAVRTCEGLAIPILAHGIADTSVMIALTLILKKVVF